MSVHASLSKTLGVVSLLLLSPGCTTTAPSASDAEKDSAGLAYLACLDKYTPRLDDRVSKARVIAAALVNGPCKPESDRLLEIFSRGLSPLARQKFYDSPYSVYVIATDAVLSHRARR